MALGCFQGFVKCFLGNSTGWWAKIQLQCSQATYKLREELLSKINRNSRNNLVPHSVPSIFSPMMMIRRNSKLVPKIWTAAEKRKTREGENTTHHSLTHSLVTMVGRSVPINSRAARGSNSPGPCWTQTDRIPSFSFLQCGAASQFQCFVLLSSRSSGYQLRCTVAVVSTKQPMQHVKKIYKISRLRGRLTL